MTIEDAYRHLNENLRFNPASFYGSSSGLSLGTGLIFDGVDYPAYSKEHGGYLTVEGMVWVVTHECDIDPANNRPFNDHVLVCPIIKFENFVTSYLASRSAAKLKAFLGELAAHNLTRVCYIPMISDALPFGGIIDFNKMSSAHVSVFGQHKCRAIAAMTDFGQGYIDRILNEHFFRAKSEALPRGLLQTVFRLFQG